MDKGYIYHDSHNAFYREPFGAVTLGTNVKLRLELKDECEVYIEVLKFDGTRESILMIDSGYSSDHNSKVFAGEICTNSCGVINYYFRVVKGGNILFYGNNDQCLGGIGRVYYNDPKLYQITVYKQSKIPEWFKEGIIYQIFVDRFCNGNDDNHINNPKENSFIYGSWYDSPMYIKDLEGKVIRWDFYGGNLKGVIKKLPYIKSLGASIIYMNPIFEAISCHKYDTGNYEKIDPMFGDTSDFKILCEEANKIGIKIILDGVFSHTGADSKYFNKSGSYHSLGAYESRSSPYFNWYRFYQYPDRYECWWGFENQPNVDELNDDYVNYIVKNKDSIIARWMNLGASGWRLDVADELPDEFIKMIKTKMNEVNEDNILIGEVWEDASNKISYSKKREYLFGDELDSVTNYPLRDIIIGFSRGEIDCDEFKKRFMSLYENYPRDNIFATMNLLGNHDTERILTRLDEKISLLKVAMCIQMTLPGVPLVYYGDEVGLIGGKDPENRKPYPWGREDVDILQWFKEIISIRNAESVLVKGDIRFIENTDKEILSYMRFYDENEILIIANSSDKSLNYKSHNINGKYVDILNGYKEYNFINEAKLLINPYDFKILKKIF